MSHLADVLFVSKQMQALLFPQGSSSSDSLEGRSSDYAHKSYDAVVFDVLKVTPEEFAVSRIASFHFVCIIIV